MNRKKLLLAIGALLLTSTVAYGTLKTLGLGFVAPTIDDKDNVYSPQAGEIVYDSSNSTFYGHDHATSWVPLGGSAQLIPPGTILPYGGTTAPAGFELCDGTSYLRADPDYAALFAAISTAFGAADGTHFNVPDLRGRFLRGVDDGAGVDPDTSSGDRPEMKTGGNTGDNVGSIQDDAFQGHKHGSDYANINNWYNLTNTGAVQVPQFQSGTPNTGDAVSGSFGTARVSTETRPKNANVNFIIKL